MTVNKVILVGRLGANPELRYTPNQVAVCQLNVATNERRKNASGEWAEHTEWHRVTVWDKKAENCAQYLQKGRQVYVEGRIQTNKWQDKEGKDRYTTEIVAEDVKFLGSKSGDEGLNQESSFSGFQSQTNSSSQSASSFNKKQQINEAVSLDDDDIPF